ncbi:MAG TPA: N-acetyltransferase [Pirellulaceae bacterium]|nr:N-acetyltransferase [Pirellulaceae bacterium]
MIAIRREASSDVAAIQAVNTAAFPTNAEALLVDRLRTAGQATLSLVAVVGERIIGHVLFSPVMIMGNDGEILATGVGLAPVAVDAAFRRQGVADRLIRRGFELCQELHTPFVVVLGDPRYYSRFGFELAQPQGIANEYQADQYFQLLVWDDAAMPRAGLAKFHEEFARL